MSAPTPDAAPTWQVTSTIASPDPNSTSPGAVVYTITFETGSGASGQVSVPDSQIGDTGRVRALIEAKARQLHAVATLSTMPAL